MCSLRRVLAWRGLRATTLTWPGRRVKGLVGGDFTTSIEPGHPVTTDPRQIHFKSWQVTTKGT
ncbi:MAG: hypothetical protein KAU28_03235, partial [Phycisphaerae bacterium]|nr:hypothetical protein [Phycisphaerae bacterium]